MVLRTNLHRHTMRRVAQVSNRDRADIARAAVGQRQALRQKEPSRFPWICACASKRVQASVRTRVRECEFVHMCVAERRVAEWRGAGQGWGEAGGGGGGPG